MKVVVDEVESKDEGELLIIGIADNSLKDPIECITHTIREIIKAGHTVLLYTYTPTDVEMLESIKEFLTLAKLEDLTPIPHNEVTADVYYDDRNYGNAPGMYALYGSFLAARLIAHTHRNLTLFQDRNFWITGEEGKLDLITQSEPNARKIILPNGLN